MSNDNNMSIQEFIDSKISWVYVNHFTEESAKNFYCDFTKARSTGQTIVPIIIDSYGGSVDALVSMMDVIDSAQEISVATIAMGKTMSAGAVLLSCGREDFRFSAPGTRIMVHGIHGMAWGREPDIQVTAKETTRLQKYIYHRMAQNCGHEKNYFLDLIKESGNSDIYLTAKEAKKHNLINHIKIPELRTGVALVNELY